MSDDGLKSPTREGLHHRLFWLTLGLAYLATIFWLSLTPHPPQLFHLWDKAEHFLAYAGLAGWFCAIYRRPIHLRVALAAIIIGVAIEYLQRWSGYRDFEFDDMLADALGTGVGVLLARSRLGLALLWLERVAASPRATDTE